MSYNLCFFEDHSYYFFNFFIEKENIHNFEENHFDSENNY